MSKAKILLVGGGGHCKSVIEAIESENRYEIAGIVDMPDKVGQQTLGYPVLGTDNDLAHLISLYSNVVITVGQLKSASKRIELYNLAKQAGATLPLIIAATAHVSKHATVGEGTVILHQAFVNAGANIGANVIINTGAIIEHDARIGSDSHVSTGAVVNGDCEIGQEVLIGSNAVLKQGIKIADKTIVGAGTVVVKNIVESSVIVGNPAKPQSKN